MKSNITPNNLSTILIRKPKYLLSENTQNKSTNTIITDLINSNQRFSIKKKSETNESKKYMFPYFLIKSRQKNNEIKKQLQKCNNHFLPVISNNKYILKSINKNKKEINNSFKVNKIQNRKRNELLINPVLLYLNTESNEKKGNIFNNFFTNKNKGHKIRDDFLERVKDYRRQLKEQMIKRNKFQYSHSNKSFNNSLNKKNESETSKEIKLEKLEKENDENRFNYNNSNKYIFKMNESVDKSLNIFHNKLGSRKIIKYNKDKSFINYSNLISERSFSTSNKNEISQKKFCTINNK